MVSTLAFVLKTIKTFIFSAAKKVSTSQTFSLSKKNVCKKFPPSRKKSLCMETFLDQGKIFVQQRIFLERWNFLETEFSIKMIKEMFYKKLSFIKETFHKQRLFLDQGSFPQTKIYLQSRKLSNVFLWSRKYFKVEKVFSSKKKFLKQRSKKFLKMQDFRSIQ